MRIVHLANHAQPVGNGAVNLMVDLACLQARAGHDVVVASAGGGFEPLLRRHGITHVLLQQSRQPWRVPAMIAGFARLIERFDPDVVHAHMMTGALISRFASMQRRFALVTTMRHAMRTGASLVRSGERMVAVSHAVARALVEHGAPRERISVVLNGAIGSPRLACRPLLKPPVKPWPLLHPNVVCVAGMFRRKGIADLLHAFAQVRDAHAALARHEPGFAKKPQLYLVGDGPDREEMVALAAQLGVAHAVHFVGFVPDPRPYLMEADVFALPSHEAPCPLALSEAREAGCAIVATRVGGIPELLDDGEAGVLVPPDDPPQLAAKLHWLLIDSGARDALRSRARQNLAALSADRACAGYLAVYEQAIAERATRLGRQAAYAARRARTTDPVL